MKKILLFILALAVPTVIYASIGVPWYTPSLSAGYITSSPVNGTGQRVLVTPDATNYGFVTAGQLLELTQNSNTVTQSIINNKNSGGAVLTGYTLTNANTVNNANPYLDTYYGGMYMAGNGFNTYPGLNPNDLVVVNSDGMVHLAALSANTASSTITFSVGPGFTTSNYDMVLKAQANGTGFLGLGTIAPTSQLHVVSPLVVNSGTVSGFRNTTSFTPTGAAYTTDTEANYLYSEVNSSTAVDSAASAVLRSVYGQSVNFSNHAINSEYGVTGETALGFGATGSINSAYGIHGDIINNGGVGGLITNAFPVFSECRSTGNSTINTCVGLYGDLSYTSGNIQNYIGIKIPSHTGVASSSIGALIGDNVGIGTTTAGTLLSIGTTNGINISENATSTFGKGINIKSGCFAINGSCVGGSGGGSGTVTSVATDGTLTGGPITTTGTLGIDLSAANAWTSTATTSFVGSLQLPLTAGYDNMITLKPGRTYGNSSNAAVKEGVLDIDGTASGRILLNIAQGSGAGTGCSPECVNIQQQSTTATGILMKIKTSSTQFAGNLGISIQGPTAPALELNQDIWNGGLSQQGGGLFQISSRDNNFTIDGRNQTNSGYCRQFDLSPDFSTTTSGRMTFFPCLNAGGSTQLGTGRYNFTGTSTVATLVNFDSTNSSTEGDIMMIKENGNVSIGTTTATSILSLGYNNGTTNATSTITTGKWQIDGYNSAGTRECSYLVGTTFTTTAGACNQ